MPGFVRYAVRETLALDPFKGLRRTCNPRREIAATKAYTIGRRGAYKDYIDLYFTLSERHATLTDIIDAAERKFGFEFNSRLFLEQLVFLDDVEDTDIQFVKAAVTRAELLNFFEANIRSMLSASSSLVRQVHTRKREPAKYGLIELFYPRRTLFDLRHTVSTAQGTALGTSYCCLTTEARYVYYIYEYYN